MIKAVAAWCAEMKRRRQALHMTLEQLAEGSGMTPNYLSTIENGKRDPCLSSVLAIARGLGCDAREMFGAAEFSAEDLELLGLIKALPTGDFKKSLIGMLRSSAPSRTARRP